MEMNSTFTVKGSLSALVIRADGSHRNCGVIAADRVLEERRGFWRKVWTVLKREGKIPAAMGFAAFLAHFVSPDAAMALVTTTGATYMAADFATGGSSPTISGFKYHDCGTGTTAAAISDTALGTAFGGSRVAGTGSTPGSTNVYQSVATISFSGTFAITEWGLFSASTSGTLWDRRVFSALNVGSGDSIQFTYQLTVPAGGS